MCLIFEQGSVTSNFRSNKLYFEKHSTHFTVHFRQALNLLLTQINLWCDQIASLIYGEKQAVSSEHCGFHIERNNGTPFLLCICSFLSKFVIVIVCSWYYSLSVMREWFAVAAKSF